MLFADAIGTVSAAVRRSPLRTSREDSALEAAVSSAVGEADAEAIAKVLWVGCGSE